MNKLNNYRHIVFCSLIMVTCTLVTSCANNANVDIFHHDDLEPAIVLDDGDYKLEKVLIMSRHNIRSPLTGDGSTLGEITPHEWFKWTSKSGELSVKGGQLETNMGQFFRKYLEAKEMIPENWIPDEGETWFYSNSMQRTIATANFFATGMLPVGDIKIDYQKPYGTVNPIFCPIIKEHKEGFEEKVRSDIDEICGEQGFTGVGYKLKNAYKLLEDTLDFKVSKYAKENNIEHIPLDDNAVKFEVDKELGDKMTGGLKLANSAVDAFKLQIYEEPNINKALFGHQLTEKQIIEICSIGDMYQEICEGTRTLATHVMVEMMKLMKSELEEEDRQFTFLCGHDSTITSLVSALDIKEYKLPGAISCKSPIGVKMMFEEYSKANEDTKYIKPIMVYNTTSQLRSCEITSLDNPPMFYDLEFNRLTKNADGYYKYNDVINRFDEAIELGKQYRVE
ncbi:MAG: histidine-type phosphatase [Bacilli bacterium]|nr:histidine-type phosphatase [Bacilli bacterium]